MYRIRLLSSPHVNKIGRFEIKSKLTESFTGFNQELMANFN